MVATIIKHCFYVFSLLNAAYIWFFGHSEKGTGKWCFKDGTISFNEIFDIYKRSQESKRKGTAPDRGGSLLTIISDCSYSGNWVGCCAETLDSMKILPCGHITFREGLQVRIYCSTREDQEAQELRYSTMGVKANEQGDFDYQDTRLNKSPLQQTSSGDFTKLVCCREDKNSLCGMEEKNVDDWTWTDFVTEKFRESVFNIQGYRNDEKCWVIILLYNRGPKFIQEYRLKSNVGPLEVCDWGYVLESGYGEKEPPEGVLMKVTQWTFV